MRANRLQVSCEKEGVGDVDARPIQPETSTAPAAMLLHFHCRAADVQFRSVVRRVSRDKNIHL